MSLPYGALLLIMATLGRALVLNDTQLKIVKPTPNDLSLAPLPNPFPVPGTDITLDFLPQPTYFPQPSETEIAGIFARARSDLAARIRTRGDGPIMYHEYIRGYRHVEIAIHSSDAPMNPFRYSDALSVILGISLKMSREGVQNVATEVLRTGQPVAIGLAAVYRVGTASDSFS